MNLEKVVETKDCTDDTDQQGFGLGSPHTCEVSARPGWKPPVQPRPSVESVESVVKTTAALMLKTSGRGFEPLPPPDPPELTTCLTDPLTDVCFTPRSSQPDQDWQIRFDGPTKRGCH